jgi:MoaA/NifB/PqqE/SkfB family radical SAM enzyme
VIVVWRLTERCNLSCPFCAFDRRLNRQRLVANAHSVMQFARVLGDYRRRTDERVLVSWIGGEPLLWPALFEVSHQLHHEYGIAISATTNGTTLHVPGVQQRILESFAELTISVDGDAEFHDRLRGAPGNWQQLCSAMRALAHARDAQARPLRLRANTVLMHDNLPMFAALCHTLADWGVVEITFNQLGGRDRPEYFPANRLHAQDAARLATLLPVLRAELAERGVRLCGSAAYLQRIEASAMDKRIAVADCQPGERFLFIDERGLLGPCSFTMEELSVPISCLATTDDLMALPARFFGMRQRLQPLACGDCPSTQVFPKFAE